MQQKLGRTGQNQRKFFIPFKGTLLRKKCRRDEGKLDTRNSYCCNTGFRMKDLGQRRVNLSTVMELITPTDIYLKAISSPNANGIETAFG